MNIVSTSNTITMSSREIADLVGARHDNVRVTIERLAAKGVIALPATQEKATAGRPSIEYVFSGQQGKRDSYVVVAQLCPEFTAKLVDRWQELEARQDAPLALNDPAQLRTLLLGYTEKVIELESKVAEQAPSVAALERISVGEGSLVPREAAKCVGTTQTGIYDWLLEHKWCYREAQTDDRKGRLRAYSTRIASGDLEERLVSAGYTRDGVEQYKAQVYVTPKGQTKIAKRLAMPQIQEDWQGGVYVPPPTLQELHDLAVEAGKVAGPDKVRAIIARFGAPKLVGIDPDKYADLGVALERAAREPF